MSTYNFMGMDPFKLFDQSKSNQFYESLMSACQKNLEIFSQTQKTMIEAVTNLGKMQTSFACYAMQEAGNHMNDMARASSVEEKMNLHKEALKKGVEQTANHSQKMAEEWSKSQQNIVSKLSETVDTMKKASANKH